MGIEDTFIRDERPGRRRLDEYELTLHREHWREDLALAARSGAELIRWGVPWWQVEPVPGRFELGWVDEVAQEMDDLGLTCVVDLVHYGTPAWLPRSFVDPGYPEAVARYAATLVDRYHDVWTWWTPVNEPMITAIWCGRDGRWPPYLQGDEGLVRVVEGVVDGAQRTTRAIRETDPSARVLHVEAGFRWAGDWPGGRGLMDEWRFLATDLVTGRRPARSAEGYLAASGLSPDRLESLLAGGTVPDVMGFNYYPGFTTQRWEGEHQRPTALEAGVEGLIEVGRAFSERYQLPLALTETSRATADPSQKMLWLDQVMAAARGPLADVDLRAVLWSPFLDMVDWDYREATGPSDDFLLPFGLVSLRRTSRGDLSRVPTPALEGFRRYARDATRERSH